MIGQTTFGDLVTSKEAFGREGKERKDRKKRKRTGKNAKRPEKTQKDRKKTADTPDIPRRTKTLKSGGGDPKGKGKSLKTTETIPRGYVKQKTQKRREGGGDGRRYAGRMATNRDS